MRIVKLHLSTTCAIVSYLGIVLVKKELQWIAAQRWCHLHSAPRMAQYCLGRKRHPLDVLPLLVGVMAFEETAFCYENPGFLGSKKTLLVLRPREMQHATACQPGHGASDSYNRGTFSAASICPGILKRPGVIRCYFRHLGASYTHSYTRTMSTPTLY
ncbi:hypothetical protein GGI43DRAFT_414862 [Trichoderma evansii]